MLVPLITAGTFLAIALLIFLVGRLLIGGRNRAEDLTGRRKRLILGGFTEAFASVIPVMAWRKERIRKDLVKAGYYHRYALEEYLGMRNAAIIAWAIFLATAIVALAEPGVNYTPYILAIGAVVLILLYAIPGLVLGSMSKNRTARIEHALPDALDMINMMVTGGLPVRQAVKRVSAELTGTHPDLACELAIIDHQAEARSLDQALDQFSKRVDVPDVIALSTMVRHADRIGGNVAVAFRDYSDSVRRSRRQRAEERGNKASVKLLFPMVLFLAPPIYILLLGPAVLELRNFMERENRPGGVLSQETMTSQTSNLNNVGGERQ